MKCIYNVETVHNGQTHSRTKWQEGMTESGMILPLIPTGFNAVLDKRDDLYIVQAGHGGETIAITNDANTAIERARKADRRKPLAYVDEDGKLVVTDKENENEELARFAKVSPDFVYYVHYYNTKDLKLVAISYRSRDGFIKSKKPIVVEGVDKAKEKMKRIAQKESETKEKRRMYKMTKTNDTTTTENKPQIELLRVTNVGEVKTIVYRGRKTATIDVDLYTIDSEGKKEEGTYVIHTPGKVFAETFAIAKALHKKHLSDELVIFTLSSDVARLINDKSGYGKAFNDLYASFHRNDVKPKAYTENGTDTGEKTEKETK